MPAVARRHHFLPQGYLAGFTDTGRRTGVLHVRDIKTHSTFRTTPLNVAVATDFKRIDMEGQAPDAVEVALAPIEDRAVQAIRHVTEEEQFPSDRDYNLILNLLSLTLAQNPKSRGALHRHQPAASTTSVETLRAEFAAQDELLDALAMRTWSVLLAPKLGPYFITSDYPFSLTMEHGFSGVPSFLRQNTELYFPLSKTAGFIGVIGNPLRPVVRASHKAISVMNRRIVRGANRQLYISSPTYTTFEAGAIVEVQA